MGIETQLFSHWFLQIDLDYNQTNAYQVQGHFIQGTDPGSEDQYTYQFEIITRQLIAQTKFLYHNHGRYYPYFLLGIGEAFNTASNFTTSVPPFLTFTRQYADKQSRSFTYRVGLGLDMEVTQHARIGLVYRYSDRGSFNLGNSEINQISVPGTLSQAHLFANELMLQISYVI